MDLCLAAKNSKNQILSFFLSLVLALCFSITNFASATVPKKTTLPSTKQSESPSTIKITVLGTSDIHANLWGYSYEDSKETENNGIARVSTYLNSVKKENPNTIIIDNGDTYQGNILSDDIYNKKTDKSIHPITKAMNYMGYKSMTLGNHEFNFGLNLIKKIKSESKFEILGANVTNKDGSEFVKPYIIVDVKGVRIGILGLTNPNAPRWDGDKVKDLAFTSMVESAKKYVKILKEKEFVDLVVVSAHAGLSAEYDLETLSDSAEAIAKQVPQIDALLIGHYHINVSQKIGKTLVGAPINSGREVVRFDFNVEKKGNKFNLTSSSLAVIDMKDYAPDKAVRDLIKTQHKATIDFISGVGSKETGGASGGIFGVATATFQPPNEVPDVPQGKLQDTAVINLINTVQLKYSGADVSSAALFKDTSDIKKGNITYGDIFNIYKFDNTLYVVEVTGKELKNYMEWSAAHYNTWVPGDVSISFNKDIPGYRYDMFLGVDYKIDLSKPSGSRIKDVTFKGKPLSDTQKLKLAVNNYRYSSALKAEKLVAADRSWESPKSIRDYIVQYIEENKTISPKTANNWKIVGVDLNHPRKAEAIKLVVDKKIDTQNSKSLNIDELIKQKLMPEKK